MSEKPTYGRGDGRANAPVGDDTLYVLTSLVQQLQDSGWRDKFGHPIENNVRFQAALALVKERVQS